MAAVSKTSGGGVSESFGRAIDLSAHADNVEPDVGDWHIPAVATAAKGRPVTARKRTLALSRSLGLPEREPRIAELEQEIDRLQQPRRPLWPQVRHASADARHGSCWVSRPWRRVARYMGRCTVVNKSPGDAQADVAL